MSKKTLILWAAICCACSFPEEGLGEAESSSSSGDGTTQPPTTATTDVTSAATTATSSDDPSSSDDGESTEESTSDASTDEESSTGEPDVTDFALKFAGNGSVQTTGPLAWGPLSFTIEAWIEITSFGAKGILIDQQNTDFNAGWMLCFHPESGAIFASFFNEDGYAQVVSGPTAEEIGLGWHHIAMTNTGSTLLIHVDGTSEAVDSVSQSVATVIAPIRIGHNDNAGDEWSLTGATIDDIRMTSDEARYTSSFDPPVVFEADDLGTISLLVDFDEGDGVSASAADGIIFEVDGINWVPGLAE